MTNSVKVLSNKILRIPLVIIALMTTLSSAEDFEQGQSHFKKIVVIFLENEGYQETAKQPFFKEIAARGALLTQFYAETHPSQPNYIAFASGTTSGVFGDGQVDLTRRHLGDLFEDKGLTWKNYAEALPSPCFKGMRSGTYARKHVPFISFTNVSRSAKRCERSIVSAESFVADVKGDEHPTFSFYTPDMKNDGHDTGVAYAARAMEKTFKPLLDDPAVMSDTLFVFTFDEDDGSNGNRIYTVFIGSGISAGTVSTSRYDHYSLLKTIEDEYGLGNLGQNDKTAKAITGIWQ